MKHIDQLKKNYYLVNNPHPYFTATGDHIGAVRAWPNKNVTSHKLAFKEGYHIYTLFFCILVYIFTHLALIVSMNSQADNYIIYNVVILD